MFFDFNDFILSICYLTIFSKYENKTLKITPLDIEETSEKNIEKFLQNLGLKLPFNKVELEKLINERRSMAMKDILSMQHSKKLEEAKNYINNNKKLKNKEENENNINDNTNNKNQNDKNKKSHDIKNGNNNSVNKNINEKEKINKINNSTRNNISGNLSRLEQNSIDEKGEDEEEEDD